MKQMELFVSGRISLLGGLSDLVSPYLSENKQLIPGCAIASGIENGIYAKVSKSDKLEFEMEEKRLSIEMNNKDLEQEIEINPFYSYICGVALCMKQKYNVEGIKVIVTKMDLPIKKGLASSAAICVLVTRAFNKLYDLNLTIDEERELAYEAEHLAGSTCGRLDQVCASGKKLYKITFYENHTDLQEIKVKKEIHMVVADLNGKKDTKRIMTDLNKCFPNPHNENEKLVHEMVGIKNKELVDEAQKCIETGNIPRLGEILKEAQILIDRTSVVCKELEAKILHKVLDDETIKRLSYGGKGIGSGGDGSVQILAKNKEAQKELMEYFNTKLKMNAFTINLK